MKERRGEWETRRRGEKNCSATSPSPRLRVSASPRPFFILPPSAFILAFLLLCATSCVPEDERYKEIRPGIKATTSGVEVTNKDSFNYPKVTVYLNGTYETSVGDIPPGKTISIPFDKFTDGNARFDISTKKLRYIRVKVMFGKNASDINFEVH